VWAAAAVRVATAAAPHIDAIVESLDECLRISHCRADAIELCILTGGPTAMPPLAAAVTGRLPRAAVQSKERLSSVAIGLGHAATRVFGN
jgi:actin-like ATPase involved in cell morphogenesis